MESIEDIRKEIDVLLRKSIDRTITKKERKSLDKLHLISIKASWKALWDKQAL